MFCFLSSNRVTTIIWDTFIVFFLQFFLSHSTIKFWGGFDGYLHGNAGDVSCKFKHVLVLGFFCSFLLSLHTIHSFHQLISIIIWPGWTKLSCILWFLSKNEYIDGFHKFSLCFFMCFIFYVKLFQAKTDHNITRNLQLPDTLHFFRVGMILFFCQFWGGFVGDLLLSCVIIYVT